jgi:hypothetical protein
MNLRLSVLSIACLAAAVVSNPIGHAQQAQRLLYAGVPGVGNAVDHGGIGILVFDIDHGYKFIKRIPTWSSSDGRAEGVRGIAAAAAAGRLFVSTSRRLAAIDLATDKVVWEQNFGGKCCDRMAISPDGSTLYVPAAGAPKWYVVNAADGALIATVDKEGSRTTRSTRTMAGMRTSRIRAECRRTSPSSTRRRTPSPDRLDPSEMSCGRSRSTASRRSSMRM